MEMFKTAAGVDIQAVPYKGDAGIFPALITGEIQVAVVPMATSLGHVQAGTVRARWRSAAPSARRRCPTCRPSPRAGSLGFESTSWQGWFVPANTPREVVAIIQRAAAKALTAPDLLERLRVTGNEPVGSTPEEFEARFKADLAKFAKIVKEAHIPAQD